MIRFLRSLLMAALLLPTFVNAAESADARFAREFGENFFDAWWQQYPDYAIGVGYYQLADRLSVPDAASRASELRFLDRWEAKLKAYAPTQLNADHRSDQALLQNAFDSARWYQTGLKQWQWDPSVYNVAEPFARLLDTDYAPLDARLRTVSKRLAAVPAYYAAARANIAQPTREHTQLAIGQNEGALEVFGEDFEKQVAGSGLKAEERALLLRRLAAARAAISDYVAWLKALDTKLAAGNARSFRLGREDYQRKFGYDIQSGYSADELYQRAIAEKERLHERMDKIADQLWPQVFPDEPRPADRLDRIGRVIAKLSERHAAPAQFFDEVQRQIPELTRWVNDHNLLTLDPDKPLEVRKTPGYQKGVAMAGILSPGPYDRDAKTYYNVQPLEDYNPAGAESLLREYNEWILQILNIHEAVPGHYVQLIYSNRSPSLVKSIFGNGAMVEGWAVYGERMMLESGYGADAPEMWLMYSKWNLRSVCNTILDYGVHVLGMSEDEVLKLLTREAFQSEAEAKGKWRRVQLTSVQLTSYYAGYAEIYEFRERLKQRQGAAFDLKRFHEQFLSYGSAPVRVIRELMGDVP